MSWLVGILANYKTTAAGLASILTALADGATALSHGQVSGNLATDIAAIIAGIGLIAAADGSKVAQVAQTAQTAKVTAETAAAVAVARTS